MPERSYTLNSELDLWAKRLGIGRPRLRLDAAGRRISASRHGGHLDACIHRTRCRARREEQVNDVIGYAFRGSH